MQMAIGTDQILVVPLWLDFIIPFCSSFMYQFVLFIYLVTSGCVAFYKVTQG